MYIIVDIPLKQLIETGAIQFRGRFCHQAPPGDKANKKHSSQAQANGSLLKQTNQAGFSLLPPVLAWRL
jgi:hypothetical protein